MDSVLTLRDEAEGVCRDYAQDGGSAASRVINKANPVFRLKM